jgi:hypothetical protein
VTAALPIVQHANEIDRRIAPAEQFAKRGRIADIRFEHFDRGQDQQLAPACAPARGHAYIAAALHQLPDQRLADETSAAENK